jgi:hypothetical protein
MTDGRPVSGLVGLSLLHATERTVADARRIRRFTWSLLQRGIGVEGTDIDLRVQCPRNPTLGTSGMSALLE